VAEARDAIAKKVNLPTGMYVEYAGAAEAKKAATRELLLHGAIALVGILLLLAVAVGRMGEGVDEARKPSWAGRLLSTVIGPQWPNLFLVLINLPLALAGGVLAVYIMSLMGAGNLSMGAMVGFVTLFGVTTRNSILLISHYEHLVTVDGEPWNLATAIRGASERLVPILMTASVTALGLLPLALGSGEAGREIEGPMAQVILGGLATSAALNLLVLPTLAVRFGRFTTAKKQAGEGA
jgi:Cu/Ag efflux pump CusA